MASVRRHIRLPTSPRGPGDLGPQDARRRPTVSSIRRVHAIKLSTHVRSMIGRAAEELARPTGRGLIWIRGAGRGPRRARSAHAAVARRSEQDIRGPRASKLEQEKRALAVADWLAWLDEAGISERQVWTFDGDTIATLLGEFG